MRLADLGKTKYVIKTAKDGQVTSGRPQKMGRGISLPESTPKDATGASQVSSRIQDSERIGSRREEGGNFGTLALVLGQGIPAPPFLLCGEGEAVGRRVRKRKPMDTQLQPSLMAVKAVPCTQLEGGETRFRSLWFSSR